MTNRPGINVTTRDAVVNSAAINRYSTLHLASKFTKGPGNTPTPIRSNDDLAATFGTETDGHVVDALKGFFAEGGQQALVTRLVGPAAVKATLALNDRAGGGAQPTLRVTAPYPGSFYNAWQVAVANGVAANTFRITVTDDTGAVYVTSPDLTSPAAAVTWFAMNGAGVTVTNLASATNAPNNNPAVLAATSLATGADDVGSLTGTEDTTTASPKPGQFLVPFVDATTAAAKALAIAVGKNKILVLAPAAGLTFDQHMANLVALRATLTAEEAARTVYFPNSATLRNQSTGADEKITSAGVACGLIARNDDSYPLSQPAAGIWGICHNVSGIPDEYTLDQIGQLNAAGGSCFRTIEDTAPRLYGYRTVSANPNRRSLADARVVMSIQDECNMYMENFEFGRIDSKLHKLSECQGGLLAICARHYGAGDLFGDTPADAYSVDVGSLVNTPSTIAAGEVHASIGIKTAPYAEAVFFEIVKTPLTQALA